ncbi:MAG: LamG-like jellyroll fold domain-containing protein [candidate division WOR-3 bacterium]
MNVYRGNVKLFFKGDNSLFYYFPLGEDLFNHSNNLIVNSATLVSGNPIYKARGFRSGNNSLFFNENIRININPSNIGMNDFTSLIWFKVDKYNTENRYFYVFGHNSPVNSAHDFLIYKSDHSTYPGLIESNFWSNTLGTSTVRTTKRYDDNNWHLASVIRKRPDYLAILIDGKDFYLSTTSVNAAIYSGNSRDSVGYHREFVLGYMRGYLSDYAMFSRVLSPQEIKSYYQWATGQKKLFFFPLKTLNTAIIRRRLLIK